MTALPASQAPQPWSGKRTHWTVNSADAASHNGRPTRRPLVSAHHPPTSRIPNHTGLADRAAADDGDPGAGDNGIKRRRRPSQQDSAAATGHGRAGRRHAQRRRLVLQPPQPQPQADDAGEHQQAGPAHAERQGRAAALALMGGFYEIL